MAFTNYTGIGKRIARVVFDTGNKGSPTAYLTGIPNPERPDDLMDVHNWPDFPSAKRNIGFLPNELTLIENCKDYRICKPNIMSGKYPDGSTSGFPLRPWVYGPYLVFHKNDAPNLDGWRCSSLTEARRICGFDAAAAAAKDTERTLPKSAYSQNKPGYRADQARK